MEFPAKFCKLLLKSKFWQKFFKFSVTSYSAYKISIYFTLCLSKLIWKEWAKENLGLWSCFQHSSLFLNKLHAYPL